MPLGLVEIVEVALTFSPFPHIVDDGSRNAAVGLVAILPDGCGVPCCGAVHIDTTVAELVMTAGIEKPALTEALRWSLSLCSYRVEKRTMSLEPYLTEAFRWFFSP